MRMIKKALEYRRAGFSIIPIKDNKKPYLLTWLKYQKHRPKYKEIREWWENNPNANIGVLTGKINNITVVDCDSENTTKVVLDL